MTEPGQMIAPRLKSEIEADWRAYRELGLATVGPAAATPRWAAVSRDGARQLSKMDGSIDFEVLRDFRRLQIMVTDSPTGDGILRNLLSGFGRGARRVAAEGVDLIESLGYQNLLLKYPSPAAGNPHVIRDRGYLYTWRWIRHIYNLGLVTETLRGRLDDGFVALDIGGSYGIFSSLLSQEFPGSHHVIVDFAESLILARYFLGTCFPEARIAGISALSSGEEISRGLIEGHDFVLVPPSYQGQLVPGSVDLVTNFQSFGEMSRRSLEQYLTSPSFQAAKYLATINRVQSWPTHENDLTILDYPIWDKDKRLHFRVSPLYKQWYAPRGRVFYRTQPYPPQFEYVGEI